MKPIECIEQITHNRLARTGLAFSAALSMAYEVSTSPAEAAGPCQTLTHIEVRNFEDLGGQPNVYDRGIDVPQDPVVAATVRYLSNGRPLAPAITTNNLGRAETMIQGPCNNGNKINTTIEVQTPDGRRVTEEMELPNRTTKRFGAWVAQKTPRPEPISYPNNVTGTIRIEGGDRLIRIEKSEDWRWLPLSIVIAGALVGLGLASTELRRRHHHE